MNISLVGLTLHVPDVERSLNFYKRLPDTSPSDNSHQDSDNNHEEDEPRKPFHVEIDCQDQLRRFEMGH